MSLNLPSSSPEAASNPSQEPPAVVAKGDQANGAEAHSKLTRQEILDRRPAADHGVFQRFAKLLAEHQAFSLGDANLIVLPNYGWATTVDGDEWPRYGDRVKTLSIEQGVAVLEQELSELKARKGNGRVKNRRRTVGMFTDNPGMKELFAEAMKLREADRREARRRQRRKRPAVS